MGIGNSSAKKIETSKSELESLKETSDENPKKSKGQTNDINKDQVDDIDADQTDNIDADQTPKKKSKLPKKELSDEQLDDQLEQVKNIKTNINNKIKNCQKFKDNIEDKDKKLELKKIINTLQNLNTQSDLIVLNTHGKHNCDKTYKKAKAEKKGSKSSEKKGSKSSEKSQLTQDQITQVKNIKTNINSKLKNCNNFINKEQDDKIKEKLTDMKNQLIIILKEEDKSKVLKTSHGEYNCDKIYEKSPKNKKSKEKYLKYKMKYLQLKNLLENN